MTDKELFRGIKENSPTAWRILYNQMKPGIKLRVSPLIRDVGDITFDDIYEDALITLMENIKDEKLTEDTTSNLSGYLYTICQRKALKHIERLHPFTITEGQNKIAKVGVFTVIESGKEQEEEIDPEVLSEEDEYVRNFLDRVLNSIPTSCQQILKRFYWDHLPMDTIAATMGLKNANTAKTTKNRCMEKFRKLAKELLEDDQKAERAIERTVERNALRDMLKEFRFEDSGVWSMAACKDESERNDQDKSSKPDNK